MPLYTITAADLEKYFTGFATKLAHAPGALLHAERPATANAIPEPLLADLMVMTAQLDPRAVGSTMAARCRHGACCLAAPAKEAKTHQYNCKWVPVGPPPTRFAPAPPVELGLGFCKGVDLYAHDPLRLQTRRITMLDEEQ
jgi:hypothetical protein